MIKFHESAQNKNLHKYIDDVLFRNNFSEGKYKELSSEILESKFGFKNFLLTNSATSSLEIMGLICKKNNISLINMPSYTFSSTANGFLRSNIDVNFIDISKSDSMIELSNIKNEQHPTLIVHYAGSSFNFEESKVIEKNFTFLEDAAQSLGVKFKNKQVGTFGRMGCISFHPTKNVHGAFAGLINFKYKQDMELGQLIIDRGTDRSKVVAGLKNKYEWKFLGSSFEITELSAAVLLSQLEIYDEIIEKRKVIHEAYTSFFQNFENLFLTQNIDKTNIVPNYHSFYIVLKSGSRKKLLEYLYSKGIQAYIGYIPLHSSSYGKKISTAELPNTDYFGNSLIRLPIHTKMDIKDAKKVCKTIISFIKNE